MVVGLAVRPEERVVSTDEERQTQMQTRPLDMETRNSKGVFHHPNSAGKIDWDISGAHDGTTGLGGGGELLSGGGGANL